jgi:asparagine synthase (glutamine-hydrolysing)
MSGMCGWIDSPLESGQANGVLADMLGHLVGRNAAPDRSIVARTSAIAARIGLVPVNTHLAGPLMVAAQGHIVWTSPELKALAAQRGDPCAVGEAYRRHGDECLQHMSGPFAVAVVDADCASGLLAVDRMGRHTMCYATPQGQFVFGSTAESVAAHPKVGCELSPQGMFNYLYCHVVPSPGTIYQSIFKLQPGECVAFRNGAVDRHFYWQLKYNDDGAESFAALEGGFRRILREAAVRAIAGNTEIGAFLSGGTDSSTVTGLLTELSGKPARTYSIGFSADGFDEMKYARITARHFSAQAHEYYLTPADVVDAIPIIAQAYDEPFGNESAVPTYFCAKMARADGIQVLLAGDGGDEIFGGNVRYARQKLFEPYHSIPAGLRRGLVEPLVFGIPGGDTIAPLRKLKSYVRQASIPLPDRLESYNFLHRSPLAEIFEPEFLAAIDVTQPTALLREVYQRTASVSPVNRMMHLDLKITLADNDLRKVSRMCEAAGVEVRYPLIDDAVVKFSGEVPASLKVKGLQLRHFFKQALKDFLPPETIVKAKHGFGLPFGLWLKDHRPLAVLVDESLDAFQGRGIIKPAYVKELLHQHRTSYATYYGTMIWVIMMLERWLAARKL